MRMAETYEKDRGLCRNYITADKADTVRRFRVPTICKSACGHSVKLRASDGSMIGIPPRTG
ncbi:hypothetical protein F9L00_00185 [Brucella anthropi]|nr:hypothetical protein F9K90_03715 [Brucella anthropi]KAB2746401.1 hypothetical protein F9L05_20105 [Brucella anthropi]KAB2754723.1 hypothetical protein F9K95_04435 [Brucella anthropi]KAB2765391.1 hypothetical protein F9K98_04480 [Brucella anthropi]KAB2781590.1 hypothetical protein F9K99_10420 [Brucella anthropi]